MNLLGTVSKALGNTRKIQMMASLDHSMWFYEPFDMSQPLLFFMQTQVSSNGRGLAMGRFYSQKGRLLAIVVRRSPHPLPLCQPPLTSLPPLLRHRKVWCVRATTTPTASSPRPRKCDHVEPGEALFVVGFLQYYTEGNDETATKVHLPL